MRTKFKRFSHLTLKVYNFNPLLRLLADRPFFGVTIDYLFCTRLRNKSVILTNRKPISYLRLGQLLEVSEEKITAKLTIFIY